jgi:DivIVA domain-containing protein
MAKATDPDGVQWSAHRRWMCPHLHLTDLGADGQWASGVAVLALGAFILLQIIVIWPFWIIGQWLGAPWTIVISRNGVPVHEERGRGNSRARIQNLTEAAAAGTLLQAVAASLPPETEMHMTPETWMSTSLKTKATLATLWSNGHPQSAAITRETKPDKHNVVEAAPPDPTGGRPTPEQVRNTAFSQPPIGNRGYNEDEVDAFLDLVEREFKHRAPET